VLRTIVAPSRLASTATVASERLRMNATTLERIRTERKSRLPPRSPGDYPNDSILFNLVHDGGRAVATHSQTLSKMYSC
jgi:hypothetical protein